MTVVRGSQKGEVSAPRWAGAPAELRSAAFKNGLEYREIAREKGWITETVWFEVSGPINVVKAYFRAVHKAISNYNGY